ncbi:MAG: caspase family protein, partial [Burkholderiales bacterium]
MLVRVGAASTPEAKPFSLRYKLALAWFCALLSLSAITAGDAAAGAPHEPRIALVIGNSAYQESPLINPVNDARAIARTLQSLGFRVTKKENATVKDMYEAIRVFGDTLHGGGIGLFYFAGHGMQVKGRNYLIPIGAAIEREDEVAYQAVDANLVLEKMETARNPLNIVILDACRNNPFTRSFRSSGNGLVQMDAPSGTLIAFATAPGSVAADGGGVNGIYTKHLLSNMTTPGLPIEQVFKRARNGVMEETGEKQVPWESSSLKGEFYFNTSKDPSVSEQSVS